jgi:hypothetical protein
VSLRFSSRSVERSDKLLAAVGGNAISFVFR